MLAASTLQPTEPPEPIVFDPRVAAAARGDRDAAESLLTELLPRVRNLVRYLVRGDDQVDDIAQDALIALLRGFGSYRGEGRLQSWADRVVARVTFANLRKRRAQVERLGRPGADLALLQDSTAPSDEYVERRRAVRLLDGLSYDQRHAVVLHHVLGMSVPDIAAELSLPLETVRSRLRLGIARLRELHGEWRS